MEQNESPQGNALTPVSVAAKINIALTQQSLSVQRLQNEADALVFNDEPENLEAISAFLTKLKKIDKVVDDAHKEIKAPILEQSRACDAGKNSLLATTQAIRTPVQDKYNKICADVERKNNEAAAEKVRVDAIRNGIENNVINFSTQIAGCVTNEQLLEVERRINLEKSPSGKKKYAEFHEQAIKRFDEVLLPIIKTQKEQIKQKEAVDRQIKEAELKNDAAKVEALKHDMEKIDNKIMQSQVDVQQNAVMQSSIEIAAVEEVMPTIKTVKRVAFEIDDLSVAVKKSLPLLSVEINYKEAQKVAMTLKDAGTFDTKDEIVVNGIKFFIDKTYK